MMRSLKGTNPCKHIIIMPRRCAILADSGREIASKSLLTPCTGVHYRLKSPR